MRTPSYKPFLSSSSSLPPSLRLWAGLPLLTSPEESLVSRVAASLAYAFCFVFSRLSYHALVRAQPTLVTERVKKKKTGWRLGSDRGEFLVLGVR